MIITLGLVAFFFYMFGGNLPWIQNMLRGNLPWIQNTSSASENISFSHKDKTIHKVIDRDENINITVYKKVSPSVVNITNKVLQYDFFFEPVLKEGSAGSGIIIDKKGHILTNYHVIKNAYRLEVTLSNRRKYPAEMVGKDSEFDIAIIKIKAPPKELYPIQIANSPRLEVGDKVLAIGNPFGLSRTLTTGIISSLGRTIKMPSGGYIGGIIQTDAAINPGNSGGPLLNTSGELIGINTLIVTPSKGSVGIGFAIPSDILKPIIYDLIRYKSRPKLGISGFPLSRFHGLSEHLKIPVENGVIVVDVQKSLSAYEAGIRGSRNYLIVKNLNLKIPVGGDVIVSINGRKIKHPNDIRLALRNKRFGDKIKVGVFRNGKKKSIFVKLIPPKKD